MNNFMKAMKLYLRTAVKPLTLLFGLGVSGTLLISLIVDPEKQGSDDYGKMVACMGMLHAMLLMVFFVGNISIARLKFFGSLPQAKVLFTDVPIAAMGIVCLVCDIIIFTAAYVRCGSGTAADLLIVDSVNTVVACFINATMCKYKSRSYTVLSALLFVMFFNQMVLLSKLSCFRNGFGVTVTAAALIAIAVYIIGFAAVHFFMQHWWNTSGRNYNNSITETVQNTVAENA
ncbi:MAG: hypothetical protein IKW96_13550 [Ruminococcus sp.]|uniref:hypothetical protein n=1 Tax=Ruminococcus sp. TaxID=41978 RepID=UPI0025F8EC1F|nr:hypothetical protein [Ruminococcus sp.]MBR5684274.1 hypothetical protein [Ruminococcus sp.]